MKFDANNDLKVPETKAFLNINLGEKLLNSLGGAIAEQTGQSVEKVMPVLNGAVDLVQDAIYEGIYNPDLGGLGDNLAEVGKMTGEERALAGFYMVQNILGQNIGTESEIYKAVTEAEGSVFNKSSFADLTNLGGVKVGTTERRKNAIWYVAMGLSDGPSDESKLEEWMVGKKIVQNNDNGANVVSTEKYRFVGGGEDVGSWRAKGGEVETTFNHIKAVQNMVKEKQPLDEKYRNSVRQIKIWLSK